MKREDIINYIDNEQDECIFIFLDGIKPAPSPSIINIFQSRVTKENANKFYLLVNIYDNQAEDVMTDDGKAIDAQVGIEYKHEEIIDKFNQSTIDIFDSNLLFYNARRNTPQNTVIFEQIKNNIEEERSKLFATCLEIKTAYEKLKYDFENKEYAFKNFDELYAIVLDISSPTNLLEKIIISFVDKEKKNLHHATIHALNKYDGEYYSYNFYYWFSIVAEQMFDDVFMSFGPLYMQTIFDYLDN